MKMKSGKTCSWISSTRFRQAKIMWIYQCSILVCYVFFRVCTYDVFKSSVKFKRIISSSFFPLYVVFFCSFALSLPVYAFMYRFKYVVCVFFLFFLFQSLICFLLLFILYFFALHFCVRERKEFKRADGQLHVYTYVVHVPTAIIFHKLHKRQRRRCIFTGICKFLWIVRTY